LFDEPSSFTPKINWRRSSTLGPRGCAHAKVVYYGGGLKRKDRRMPLLMLDRGFPKRMENPLGGRSTARNAHPYRRPPMIAVHVDIGPEERSLVVHPDSKKAPPEIASLVSDT
jgi:hypothetical protein